MRVLLVEDGPTTSKSIEMMLTNANLNVYCTDMGEEGIDLAKLYDYDLILLDLNPLQDLIFLARQGLTTARDEVYEISGLAQALPTTANRYEPIGLPAIWPTGTEKFLRITPYVPA